MTKRWYLLVKNNCPECKIVLDQVTLPDWVKVLNVDEDPDALSLAMWRDVMSIPALVPEDDEEKWKAEGREEVLKKLEMVNEKKSS